jgi:hypothetical protein
MCGAAVPDLTAEVLGAAVTLEDLDPGCRLANDMPVD